MGMPLREFYPVKRAAELLECQVGDLLHWAAIGAISLYLSFDKGIGFVRFFGDGVKVENRNLEGYSESDFLEAINLKELLTEQGFVSDGPSFVMACNHVDGVTIPCGFSGLWALPYSALGKTELCDIRPSKYDIWRSVNNRMLVSFECDDYLQYDVDDLYLVKSDFELIRKNDGCDLPSYYSGGVGQSFDITVGGGVVTKIDDELSTKTINSRAQFIKSLLYSTYFEDLANNPRKYFDDPNSEISNDFRKKGIRLPSGKTVQSWINMVDIPFCNDD